MMGDPYEGKTDYEVFAMARDALIREASLPPGSVERGIARLASDGALAELNRRAMLHILEKIRERES